MLSCSKIFKNLKAGGELTPKNIIDSELVLGIISTVGTDTKGVIKDIADQLAFFKYKVEEIVVSRQIISQFETNPQLFTSEYDRISHYMTLGNEIRALRMICLSLQKE